MYLAQYTGPVLPAATRPHTSSTSKFAAAVNSLTTMLKVQPLAVDVTLACRARVANSFLLDSETSREVQGGVLALVLPA